MIGPANDVTGYSHYAARFKGESRWWVFTDMHLADGGTFCITERGPFASVDAAQLCADMATTAGVEEITLDMVRRARLAYLGRFL